MNMEIVKFDENFVRVKGLNYLPAFIIFNKKMYRVNDWNSFYKIVLYARCYLRGRNDRLIKYIKPNFEYKKLGKIIVTNVDENKEYVKYAPNYAIHVYSNNSMNIAILKKILPLLYKVDIYVAKYNKNCDQEEFNKAIDEMANNFLNVQHLKKGSSKFYVSRINNKVLSDKEKMFRRIERKFDHKSLIGDIDISEDEEIILNDFMKEQLDLLLNYYPISHEKVFAYGLVKFSMKYYRNKKFWPYFFDEYGITVPQNRQSIINAKFHEIMQKYKKAYYKSEVGIQNICMHAFICDKCADQLFDYVFNFWKIDLSRSIENIEDGNGNNIFNILIQEIEKNNIVGVQDIMIHTTYALIKCKKLSKNRFMRILRMIDSSFWDDTDYSESNDRIAKLFVKWINNPNSEFQKELKKSVKRRQGGRGEKLLSKPTLFYDSKHDRLEIKLPKEILLKCTDKEYPVWKIESNDYVNKIEPDLNYGKSALYSDECSIRIDKNLMFDKFDITLSSNVRTYVNASIKSDDVRFFNSKNKNIDINVGYVSKDANRVFVKNDCTIQYINGEFNDIEKQYFGTSYEFQVNENGLFILPNQHILPIGRILEEGMIGCAIQANVTAFKNLEEYDILNKVGKLFFKATREKLNGTSLKITRDNGTIYFGKVNNDYCTEFQLDESYDDIYGYFVEIEKLIENDGIYNIELGIPGNKPRLYKICYIQNFEFTFIDSPYVFKEQGKIRINNSIDVTKGPNWEIGNRYSTLTFSLDESDREQNRFVKDGKVNISCTLNQEKISLSFKIPAFYWKYNINENWHYQQPEEIASKDVPTYIYIGDYFKDNIKIYVDGFGDIMQRSLSAINYDNKKDIYYFRRTDIADFLTREYDFRKVKILIDKDYDFLKVACRSVVKQASISGDFYNKKLFGNFEIYGSSEYVVNVAYNGKIIENDIPLVNGEFSIDVNSTEGEYTISLFEIEEDEDGFDDIAYPLKKYDTYLYDIRHLDEKTFIIENILNRNENINGYRVYNYYIDQLSRIFYSTIINDEYCFDSYKYDSNEEMKNCVFYRGILYEKTDKGSRFVFPVMLVFEETKNLNKACMYMEVEDNYYTSPLLYWKKRQFIKHTKEIKNKNDRIGNLKSLYDDYYLLQIRIKEQ